VRIFHYIKNFRNDEDGAVTVDWVVLTAAIVALGLVVGTQVRTATVAKTADITWAIGLSAPVTTANVT
jgi:Flp pilus assembly pilin Flp